MAYLVFVAPPHDDLRGEVEVFLRVAGMQLLVEPRYRNEALPVPGHGLMTDPIDLAIWGFVAIRGAIRYGRWAYRFPQGDDLLFRRQGQLLLLHSSGHSRLERPPVVGISAAKLERVWRDFVDSLRTALAARNPDALSDPDWHHLGAEPNPQDEYARQPFASHDTCFRLIDAVEDDAFNEELDQARPRWPLGHT